jgi:hypothetical protein
VKLGAVCEANARDPQIISPITVQITPSLYLEAICTSPHYTNHIIFWNFLLDLGSDVITAWVEKWSRGK